MEPSLPRPEGGFATRAVRGATIVPEVVQQPVSPAIWPSATWATPTSAEVGDLLVDATPGYAYGRYDNPTATTLHGLVASLHEAPAAWASASGTAAIHAVLSVLRGRGRILATSRLYGGTWALLRRLAAESGWEVDHADLLTAEQLRAALRDEHTVVHVETIANPSTAVADLAGMAAVCRERGVALVVDNTFASPFLCRPLTLGATAVVESATKYLAGHGDVVAGVVAGSESLVAAVREHVFELGGSLGPFEAWLVVRGIQTLPLRMRAAGANALAIARALSATGVVGPVRYPGLEDHPHHLLSRELFGGRGYGGVLSFDLPHRAAAEVFADACRVFARAASLGGTHSLVLHPASTSHRQLDDAALAAAGLGPGTVRLAVGIEDEDDLVADVRQALATATEGGSR
ncbi:trans-sulfuration enzyme family protein [Egicoccus halophilus]|uniref:homocysteine desulfhydrase n=1 Tax=Egicoccus halophilus TaxID=1670830 RepID=A0A8J3A8E0_9ACTN|nr:aminotransferase class I/II-fold pyridoxal phosphate-dependent enzyme [Egicoccus halophilus]GGI06420.1 methionine gamma-lyase [Egicoccus halophilus]